MASKIAVGQITSTSNIANNIALCAKLITQAASQGAQVVFLLFLFFFLIQYFNCNYKNLKMLFLPEAADYIAESKDQSLSLAQSLDGEFVSSIKEHALKSNIWVSVCCHEKVRLKNSKCFIFF